MFLSSSEQISIKFSKAVEGFAGNLSKEINFLSKYSVNVKIAVSSDESPYSFVDKYKLFKGTLIPIYILHDVICNRTAFNIHRRERPEYRTFCRVHALL
jgi:hypothetical protein